METPSRAGRGQPASRGSARRGETLLANLGAFSFERRRQTRNASLARLRPRLIPVHFSLRHRPPQGDRSLSVPRRPVLLTCGRTPYATAGRFTVTVRVTDPGSLTGEATFLVDVAEPVPVDVTSLVSVLRGGLPDSRSTGRYDQSVTVKITSTQTIQGAISLVLDNLTQGATLRNATGTTVGEAPPSISPFRCLRQDR